MSVQKINLHEGREASGMGIEARMPTQAMVDSLGLSEPGKSGLGAI